MPVFERDPRQYRCDAATGVRLDCLGNQNDVDDEKGCPRAVFFHAATLDEKRGAGLTFGHDLDSRIVGTSWQRAMLILGKGLLEVVKAEVESECQT